MESLGVKNVVDLLLLVNGVKAIPRTEFKFQRPETYVSFKQPDRPRGSVNIYRAPGNRPTRIRDISAE